jgi:hypothetical protein
VRLAANPVGSRPVPSGTPVGARQLLQAAFLICSLLAAPVAQAERVYVKYRGEVDLAPFQCQTIDRSSVVNRLCFDPANAYVIVNLTGTYYHYCGVPAGTVRAWLSAPSMGKFFNQHIKGRFDCRVTPPPQYR